MEPFVAGRSSERAEESNEGVDGSTGTEQGARRTWWWSLNSGRSLLVNFSQKLILVSHIFIIRHPSFLRDISFEFSSFGICIPLSDIDTHVSNQFALIFGNSVRSEIPRVESLKIILLVRA